MVPLSIIIVIMNKRSEQGPAGGNFPNISEAQTGREIITKQITSAS